MLRGEMLLELVGYVLGEVGVPSGWLGQDNSDQPPNFKRLI